MTIPKNPKKNQPLFPQDDIFLLTLFAQMMTVEPSYRRWEQVFREAMEMMRRLQTIQRTEAREKKPASTGHGKERGGKE